MTTPERPTKKLLRHEAGSAELIGGTGPITAMCPLGSFLEIYKQDKTFHIRTPESVDPAETNPNAPWVTSLAADVGSSSLSVARVLLQSREMLDAAMISGSIDKALILTALHSCKESLVACEQIAQKVTEDINTIIKDITGNGIPRDNRGRGLNPFPQATSLDLECGNFLIHVNRALKIITELSMQFLQLSRKDSNFEHLARRLREESSSAESLIDFVEANSAGARYLIDLRNFHEHPGATRTVIRNFHVLPNGSVGQPHWHLDGDKLSEPRTIALEMPAAVAFVRDMAEAMFIHLLMCRIETNLPFYIEEVPEPEINPSLPIRYRLSIDFSKLQTETQQVGWVEPQAIPIK